MNCSSPHQHLGRRTFLSNLATSAGGIALAQMFAREGLFAAEAPLRPVIDPARIFAARQPHFPAKAEQVLIIFCAGAVSHLDTWDYKLELYKHHGKVPPNAPKVTFQGPIGNLAKPFWDFTPRGQCGKMISDLMPHLAELADEMCFRGLPETPLMGS